MLKLSSLRVLLTSLSIWIAFLFASCSKSSTPTPGSPSKTDTSTTKPAAKKVYVLGYEVTPNAILFEYWTNGKKTVVDSPAYIMNADLSVIQGDVYITGDQIIDFAAGNEVPVVYKNNQRSLLTSSGTSNPLSLNNYAVGNDLYVLGYGGGSDMRLKNFYWKNGVQSKMSTAIDSTAFLLAIYLVANQKDVFIVGTDEPSNGYFGTTYACYWKDGIETRLPQSATYASVYSATFSGTDLYILGRDSAAIVYWKNGSEVRFSGADLIVQSNIVVSGNDVYIGGYTGTLPSSTKGQLTKNGTIVPLIDCAIVNSVSVDGSDLYVCGTTLSQPSKIAYWKNGVETTLTDGSNVAGAFKIVVQ